MLLADKLLAYFLPMPLYTLVLHPDGLADRAQHGEPPLLNMDSNSGCFYKNREK